MNLKNYTSSVPVHQTIAFIESYLASVDVTGVTKEYVNQQPVALFFHVEIGEQRFTIRLPARIDEVHDYMWNEYASTRRRPTKTKEDFRDQATRTAWAIQRDWIQVQMSLIKLKQAQFLEVFMGYLWDGKRSYFQLLEERKFKGLIGSGSTSEVRS